MGQSNGSQAPITMPLCSRHKVLACRRCAPLADPGDPTGRGNEMDETTFAGTKVGDEKERHESRGNEKALACGQCGLVLGYEGRGRPRKYCNAVCKKAAFRALRARVG